MQNNYKNLSDSECVNEFLIYNSQQAMGEIFNRYVSDVYRFTYSKVGNREWAQDLTSEVFITLIKVMYKYDKKTVLKTFILGVAVNKIKQFWYEKYKTREESLIEEEIVCIKDDEEPEERDDSEEKIKQVNLILGKLSENYRNVLTERFINEKSIKETAKILGLTEENVRVIQYRALKKAAELGGDLTSD